MKNKYVKRHIKHDSTIGKEYFKTDIRLTVSGIKIVKPRAHRTKILFKYYKNYEFILNNNKSEYDLVVSVGSKSQASLENKYKSIKIG